MRPVMARSSTSGTSAESVQWPGCPSLSFAASAQEAQHPWGALMGCRRSSVLSTALHSLNYTHRNPTLHLSSHPAWIKGPKDFTCSGTGWISRFKMLFSTEDDSATPLHTHRTCVASKRFLKNQQPIPEIHLLKSFNVQTTSSQHCIIHSSGKELNVSTAIFIPCFKIHFMSIAAVWVLFRKTWQFPQRVQNNTQANIPSLHGDRNQPLHYKYDHWLLFLQCKTASKPGSEMSMSSLKINKWAEEAPLLCKGRTRIFCHQRLANTQTPREVKAERTFHIWMIKTFNYFIHFHHHSIFTALSITESTQRLR